jgi:hypothetical protein
MSACLNTRRALSAAAGLLLLMAAASASADPDQAPPSALDLYTEALVMQVVIHTKMTRSCTDAMVSEGLTALVTEPDCIHSREDREGPLADVLRKLEEIPPEVLTRERKQAEASLIDATRTFSHVIKTAARPK